MTKKVKMTYQERLDGVREKVTAQIIDSLKAFDETGRNPWSMGLKPGMDFMPRNAVTNKAYRGTNVMLCMSYVSSRQYPVNRWMTLNQAKKLGCQSTEPLAGKGIFLNYMMPVFARKDTGKIVSSEMARKLKEQGVELVINHMAGPFLIRSPLFNVSLFEDVPETVMYGPAGKPDEHDLASVEETVEQIKVIEGRLELGGGVVTGARACYSPGSDRVMVPEASAFKDMSNYWATLLHEFGHATGAKQRLDRDLSGMFGSPSYAKEELVAEQCAAMMCAALGIEGDLRHPEYIHSWIQVLQNDHKFVFEAANKALRAAEALLGVKSMVNAVWKKEEETTAKETSVATAS